MKKTDSDSLRNIPGVGPSIEGDFHKIGIRKISDLAGKDSELMYNELCTLEMHQIDRCVLYVFRCAVYYAENSDHDPVLLKWWNWKDR